MERTFFLHQATHLPAQGTFGLFYFSSGAYLFARQYMNWHTTVCVEFQFFFVLVFQTDVCLPQVAIDSDFVVSLKLRTAFLVCVNCLFVESYCSFNLLVPRFTRALIFN